MKVTLFDMVFRPLRTSRELMHLMKAIQLKPEFAPAKRKQEKMSEFVALHSTVLMPAAVFHMIQDSLVKVSVESWSPMTYKRDKNQELNTYDVSYENAVCMLVQERMEQ